MNHVRRRGLASHETSIATCQFTKLDRRDHNIHAPTNPTTSTTTSDLAESGTRPAHAAISVSDDITALQNMFRTSAHSPAHRSTLCVRNQGNPALLYNTQTLTHTHKHTHKDSLCACVYTGSLSARGNVLQWRGVKWRKKNQTCPPRVRQVSVEKVARGAHACQL
jgi:hypothetical protein